MRERKWDIILMTAGASMPMTALMRGLYYRAYTNNGIVRTTDCRYKVDLNEFFPDSREKDCVWAYARVYSEKESTPGRDINCFGPMTMYVNGEEVYKSDIFKERYSENATRIFPPLKKGRNLNDTHGTGIVMLAGIEVLRLTDYMNEK